MSIAKAIRKNTRVVPVRFDRMPHATDPTVEQGIFDANAPDPDSRGYLPANVRGPILPVGLDQGVAEAARAVSRCRLIREDMENAGQLFLTLTDAGPVRIELPAAGAALPNTKQMAINLRALAAGKTMLQVRFGSNTGPIIAQMQILVTAVQDLRVVCHAPTINGAVQVNPVGGAVVPAQTVRTDAQIKAFFNVANNVYFPYGLRFKIDAAVDRAGVLALTNQGFVDDQSAEFETCTKSNRVNGVINAYFVPQLANVLNNPDGSPNNPINVTHGVATSARTSPKTFGLLVSDQATNGQVAAHELGHLLSLVDDPSNQFVHINTRQDPTKPGTGRAVRDDIVSRRRLMFAFSNLLPDAARPYRNQSGYGLLPAGGQGQPGGLITIKQYDADKTDLEMASIIRTAGTLGRPPVP
jgi:hypothetical protein